MNKAFKSQAGDTDIKAWNADLEKKSTMLRYSFTVTELENLLFAFLRKMFRGDAFLISSFISHTLSKMEISVFERHEAFT